MDYLLLLSSIVAGAITVLLLRMEERGYVKVFNAFTGGFLICITFLHLLPELYGAGHGGAVHDHAHDHADTKVGTLILVGFFVQLLLDSLSRGIEHGHAHPVHEPVPIGIMLGLCLHAFVEALALGEAKTHHDPASRQMLLWSIVIHNYPVSIALLGMLLHSGMGHRRALGLMAVFAAMAPLGLLLSAHTALVAYSRELTAVVVGIFMHISTTILFESSDAHRFNRAKAIAIVAGTGLGVATVALH